MRYLSLRTREQTQASLHKHIQHWQQHNFGMWAVIHKDSNKLIGRCGLGFLENTPEVELGYVFDKSYWKMGLGTEASQATLQYGFGELKLDRIVAMSDDKPLLFETLRERVYAKPENIASIRVIQKVGMKYQKNAHYYGKDVVYYAISRSEWQLDNSPLR
nr:GNAT family N-acetyltransferase [Nostoc sp. MG11]